MANKHRGKQHGRKQQRGRKMQGVPLSLSSPGNSAVFRVTRMYESGIIPPTNDGGGAYEFKLSDVAAYSELTVLFDQYRIEGVEVVFTASQSDTTGFVWPRIYVAFDPDDSDIPTALSTLRERGNTKIYAFAPNKREFRVNLVPAAVIISETAGGQKAAISAPRGQWKDCNQAGIIHYGLKYWLEDYKMSIGSPPMRVIMRYHLAFRGSR